MAEIGVIAYYENFSTAWHRIHDYVSNIKLPDARTLNPSTDETGMRARNGGRYLDMKYGGKSKDKYIVVV